MTLQEDIARAFLTLLGAAGTAPNFTTDVTSPVTPLAVPLSGYAPTHGTAYLEAHPVLRAEVEPFGLSFGNEDFHRGIYQVDAVVPDALGELPGLRLAEAVAVRFTKGTIFAAGAETVRIQQTPSIAAAVKDAPWVRFPVSIPYLVIA